MATVKTPTKREMFTLIANKNAEDASIVEFCHKQIALLDAKSSKVDTKKTEEQRAVMDMIIAVLCETDKPMKCSEITKAVNLANGTDFSLPKISAMCKKLGEDGTKEIVKTTEKKETFFTLAPDEE